MNIAKSWEFDSRGDIYKGLREILCRESLLKIFTILFEPQIELVSSRASDKPEILRDSLQTFV